MRSAQAKLPNALTSNGLTDSQIDSQRQIRYQSPWIQFQLQARPYKIKQERREIACSLMQTRRTDRKYRAPSRYNTGKKCWKGILHSLQNELKILMKIINSVFSFILNVKSILFSHLIDIFLDP